MSSMGKRVKVLDSPIFYEQPLVDTVSEVVEGTVRVTILKDVNLEIAGKGTGTRYTFKGAGYSLPVYLSDVEGLKDYGASRKPCCGGGNSSPYFLFE